MEETMEQFIFREKTFLAKWIEVFESTMTYEVLRGLMVKEHILDARPLDLSIYLQERPARYLNEIAKLGEKFLKARLRQLHHGGRPENKGKK